MTDKPQPDKFDWATELSDAQGHVTLSAQEAKEIGARLRSMRVKLKTYEDFGDAGSDVQLLRTGYAAARLEIESLKAQLHAAKQINTAQFWLLTSSIPGSALRVSHWKAPAQAAAPAQAGEYPALVCDYCGALTPDPWHSSGMLHGKMSKHIHSCDACCRGAAQAAPAYSEACNLATALFKKHFAHLPDYASGRVVWGLCDSTAGVISQIDNMVSGLVQPSTPTPQAAQQAPAAVAGPSLYQVMAVAKAIHATTPDADDWDSLRQCEVDALRGRAEKVLAALAAAPTTQPAPKQEALEQAGERVYAFRRKGLADFCTCDEARYEELSNKPNLFETRIFYTAPQPATRAES